MLNADIEILVFLLQNNSSVCPPINLVKKSTSKLYEKAMFNKVFHALDHFTNCQNCQKHLNKSFKNKLIKHQKNSIFSSLLYEKEKQRLISFLEKTKIKGIFFKDFKNKLNQQLFLTNDLDLLTNKQGMMIIDQWLTNQGYKKTIYPPKEITYSKARYLNLDIHSMIAHPHFGTLNAQEILIVRKFSTALLNNTKHNHHIQNKNYQLLSLCIRFLFNDLATGLGTLYEIGKLTQTYKKPSQWSNFLQLAKQYQFQNEAWLMIILSNCFFRYSTPSFISKNTSWKILILAHLLPIEWFAEFPPLKFWHLKKYEPKIKKILIRLNILKLIIKNDSSLVRLIRPRIMAFFFAAIFINIRNKYQTITSSLHLSSS
ncbi:MAG: hypothetical protein A2383_00645 [Candidatus Pacebacteria bacterium RIFOXYB1_FULL_39_46]|nr:MAG: hypothetical protein A2182_00475 [Candidatus Pacebacteria bacterium RIFOXYA1_FULL_38_18]OGJ38095.1 MAG: hypothetical protein A2383_00645 [Candidatus Pacebacteria bacterium RIFOXYB1_FULL_39_46]OGJ39684.1 MAG: hypothetical protein A2411_02800 [Candidatus Pacebacteria bacterium RIFOXYC1_FULL_39_21]OGJ39847.1 MAG: hypothetical protein A2582_00410 [Candidatus Pacebacteria bacterium RIFOXYD1_FULL_39_27]